jgi:hypothetical protein
MAFRAELHTTGHLSLSETRIAREVSEKKTSRATSFISSALRMPPLSLVFISLLCILFSLSQAQTATTVLVNPVQLLAAASDPSIPGVAFFTGR